MATVEQQAPQSSNGAVQEEDSARPRIPVINPGTGEQVATVPDLDAAAVAELAKRGRAAQVGWDAYGFEGRAAVLRRMQKFFKFFNRKS